MALAPSYYGVPTPLLVLGGLGATAGLIYVATRSRALGPIAAEPIVAPPRPPQYGVEVGPAVLEPPQSTPPQSMPTCRKIARPYLFRPGLFYRFRFDGPVAWALAGTATARSTLSLTGFDDAAVFENAAQLDPSWPPDALAGGFDARTRWAQGYWRRDARLVTDLGGATFYLNQRAVTNVWECA